MKELNTSSVMGEYLVAFSETKRIQKRSALFFSVTKKEKKQYVFNAIQGPLSVLVLNISGQRKQEKLSASTNSLGQSFISHRDESQIKQTQKSGKGPDIIQASPFTIKRLLFV